MLLQVDQLIRCRMQYSHQIKLYSHISHVIHHINFKQTNKNYMEKSLHKKKQKNCRDNILTLGNGRPSVVFTEFQHSLLNSGPKIYMQLD